MSDHAPNAESDAGFIAAFMAQHRLTFWAVYPWNGGFEVAPRCTCGVLWSAHSKDDPDAQIKSWESHVSERLAVALTTRDTPPEVGTSGA